MPPAPTASTRASATCRHRSGRGEARSAPRPNATPARGRQEPVHCTHALSKLFRCDCRGPGLRRGPRRDARHVAELCRPAASSPVIRRSSSSLLEDRRMRRSPDGGVPSAPAPPPPPPPAKRAARPLMQPSCGLSGSSAPPPLCCRRSLGQPAASTCVLQAQPSRHPWSPELSAMAPRRRSSRAPSHPAQAEDAGSSSAESEGEAHDRRWVPGGCRRALPAPRCNNAVACCWSAREQPPPCRPHSTHARIPP